MTTALEHLRSLPVYWINLDRMEQRAKRMHEETLPWLGEEHRVSAVDGSTIDDSKAFEWRDKINATHDADVANGTNLLVKRKRPAGDKFLTQQEKTRRLYVKTMAVYGSHLRAIYNGIVGDHERFIVLEDDAAIRGQALRDGEVPDPPLDSDMIIWGGAIPMAAHKTDNEVFAAGKKFGWVELPHGNKLSTIFCATAYEMTRSSAILLYSEMLKHPHGADISWWFGMDKMTVHRSWPCVFTQVGLSERLADGTTRPSVLVRTPA